MPSLLDPGILFNLREMHVYRAGDGQHVSDLSFSVEALWEYAEGKRLFVEDIDRLERFVETFGHRAMSTRTGVHCCRSAT